MYEDKQIYKSLSSSCVDVAARGNYPEALPQPGESPARIRDGISDGEQLVSAVCDALAFLEKRLDSVLMPSAPTPASTTTNGVRNQALSSHVHGRIVILNEALQGIVLRIAEIANRAEV